MATQKLFSACFFLSLLIFNATDCRANTDQLTPLCEPSSCGDIRNITSPFRLARDKQGCGNPDFELTCKGNSTVLYLGAGTFIVKAIDYNNYMIRVVDPGVDEQNCSSLPLYPLSFYTSSDRFKTSEEVDSVKMIKCVKPVNSTTYLDANSCFQQLKDGFYRYAYVGRMQGFVLREGCSIEAMTLLQSPGHSVSTFAEIHRRMAFGFQVYRPSFDCPDRCGSSKYCNEDSTGIITCEDNDYKLGFLKSVGDMLYDSCLKIRYLFGTHFSIPELFYNMTDYARNYFNGPPILYWLLNVSALIVISATGRNLCGSLFVMVLIIYKWRKRHLSGYHTIEEFLKGDNNPIMPIRYAYSDIKKMTGGFKDMLGKGGFGSVYKGKLRSGQSAAIKMLSSKSKGQDFINEVATIGRIHHANIVRLIGYCSQGSKHALIYEFMSNGSLDTHIFNHELSSALNWEKLYEISLGIARGVEYLHQGCDMQILHFDIKPHNILLDENFTPKISDFGLAKFYPKMDNIATLTAAKGTIGYMAPELFYKNIGRVSFKADVYSFGMLLLEMAGKRKNLKIPTGDPLDASLSKIYYPFLVYDKLVDGDLEIEDATDEEKKMVQKMIITGLWCIQMQPSNRPSMSKVVEMLEGNLEDLPYPSRPLLSPIEPGQVSEEESSSNSTSQLTTEFKQN